ncbi:hypothetical protein HWV62_1645 [Athelia sp. TMB]|nr:hypothetical protein HWV62_1645 [Athelia sp. TMB]
MPQLFRCVAMSSSIGNPSDIVLNAAQEIADRKYRVIVVNPEILMQSEGAGGFTKLWKRPQFTNQILYFVFDEGHCISQWSSFRREYLTVCTLRYLIPDKIPFYIASATLPAPVLLEISEIMRLRSSETEYITLSCDWPDIHLVARPIKYPIHTFHDLAFLSQVPPDFVDGVSPPPPKFIAFFDSTKVTEQALHAGRTNLPRALHKKIRYFHAGMTQAYREEMYELLRKGEIWGLYATKAFGFGMDLPDVKIVVQWRTTCDMSDLWQRFGRVARAIGTEGTGILFYEKTHLDETRDRKKAAGEKRKATGAGDGDRLLKRVAGGARGSVTQTSSNNAMGSAGTDKENHANVDNVHVQSSGRETERQASYNKRSQFQKQAVARTKIKHDSGLKLDLYGPLDDFINAGTREEVRCRHQPVKLYFDGPIKIPGQLFNHARTLTRTLTPFSCPLPLRHFNTHWLLTLLPPQKISRAANRSTIPAYEATKMDVDLKMELRVWRREQATAILGRMKVRKWGDILFMSDEIIQRLVDCAHENKISSAEHIAKETRWRQEYLDQCGTSLLAIITRYSALPTAPPIPPASRVLAALATSELGVNVQTQTPAKPQKRIKRQLPRKASTGQRESASLNKPAGPTAPHCSLSGWSTGYSTRTYKFRPAARITRNAAIANNNQVQ